MKIGAMLTLMMSQVLHSKHTKMTTCELILVSMTIVNVLYQIVIQTISKCSGKTMNNTNMPALFHSSDSDLDVHCIVNEGNVWQLQVFTDSV